MALSGDGWFRVIADAFGWMVLGACRCFCVDSGGFQRFSVLVGTVKFVALNLKEGDNRGKFLYDLATMTLKFKF